MFEYIVGYVYIVNLKMSTRRTVRRQSRLESYSSKRELVDSSPTGKKFSFRNSLRGAQLKSANTNELNRDIHLAYTLF